MPRGLAIALVFSLPACAAIADIVDFHEPADAGAAAASATLDGGVASGKAGVGEAAPPGANPSDVPPGAAPEAGWPPVDACACGATESCDGDVCVMASGLSNPTTIAVSGSFVLFSEDGTPRVRACPMTGCTTNGPTLVQSVTSKPRLHRPGLGGGSVVLFDKGITGSAWEIQGSTASAVTSVHTPQAVALSSSIVAVESGSSLFVCKRGGTSSCGGGGYTEKASNELVPSAFAIVGQKIVWAENQGIYVCSSGEYCREEKNSVSFNVPGVTQMVADADAVLVVNNGSLRLVPVSPTASQKDLGSVGTPTAITADATHVYVAGSGVRVIEKSSGNAVTKYPSRNPTDIAEGGGSLYWIEGDKLIRAAK